MPGNRLRLAAAKTEHTRCVRLHDERCVLTGLKIDPGCMSVDQIKRIEVHKRALSLKMVAVQSSILTDLAL